MEYEVSVKLLVESRCDLAQVESQTEAAFEFGTLREALAEGLRLEKDPHLLEISVKRRSSGVASPGSA